MNTNNIVCRHGSLLRSCEICALEYQVLALKAEVERLTKELDAAHDEIRCISVAAPMSHCQACGQRLGSQAEVERLRAALQEIADDGDCICDPSEACDSECMTCMARAALEGKL